MVNFCMDGSCLGLGVPWLPDPLVMRWAWPGGWALVLGAAFLWLGRLFHLRFQWLLIWAVMALTLILGTASPAHWLGLAFQSPSLSSSLWCLLFLIHPLRRNIVPSNTPAGSDQAADTPPNLTIATLWGLGCLVGWVLLADVLAWLPTSLYAWGFCPDALALACGVLVVVWLMGGRGQGCSQTCGTLAGVLVLFVVTRLPTGNVWDALLDPWLWIAIQVRGAQNLWRWQSACPGMVRRMAYRIFQRNGHL